MEASSQLLLSKCPRRRFSHLDTATHPERHSNAVSGISAPSPYTHSHSTEQHSLFTAPQLDSTMTVTASEDTRGAMRRAREDCVATHFLRLLSCIYHYTV